MRRMCGKFLLSRAICLPFSFSFSFSLFLSVFLVHFFVFNTCASRKSFKFAFNVCDILFETRKKYARQCAKWRRIVHRAYQAGRSESSMEHRSSSNSCEYLHIFIYIYLYISWYNFLHFFSYIFPFKYLSIHSLICLFFRPTVCLDFYTFESLFIYIIYIFMTHI